MRPYPIYSDSGVGWLGKVPEHWQVRPFRYVCRLAYGDSLASEAREAGDVPVFGSNGVVGKHSDPNTLERAIIVGRKGSHGEVNFSKAEAFAIDTTYFVDRRYTESDLRWLYYTLLSADLADVSKDSAVPGLSREDAYEKRLPLPPLDEQRDIAAFLDRETERIDLLIAKKRLLIERLQEYRTALITRTVTRGLPPKAARAAGLDPSTRLKPSGVEWLGDVPEHWIITRLRRVVGLKAGHGITTEEIEQEGDFPVFGGNGQRGFTDQYTHDGQFVLIGRQGALCGNVHTAEGRFWASEHAVVGTPESGQNHRWLGHLLDAMNLGQHSAAAAQPGLAVDRINALHVPVPPTAEQAAIAAFLDSEHQRTDNLVKRMEEAVERLQEYRTALITAAVTGKIDVRDEASVTAVRAE
ncbi:MAG: restriction endonuclease subunit S [Chloroflexota bacterium]|nr:restriction endonuclease subunit S [Chloroflexota bacterium]